MTHQLREPLADLQRQNYEHSKVAEETTAIAIVANENLRQATQDFEQTVREIKIGMQKQIDKRDCVIQALVFTIIFLASASIFLGIKSITKC